MRKREQPDRVRDALVIVCGGIIGVAFIVELKFIPPYNPTAAIFIVLGAALIATAATLHFSRR
ncbi:MAG: hypothetical protein EOO77_09315 [Oxalobacteraceae bacterium]|uniref:hypothetical protein n=1 Tax=unclassified Methylobacterium TaxID=2615210 RepID=UPI0010E842A7|nr:MULTISPECIES: hypothetical protein [unclassified Methylobacterium]RYF19814.1 MAG: hypothetical protein EOO77_09315 [Oxalobacteraceae bacterium]TXM90763.1 hypothetical protein FV223_17465 [Methylobacterium sp. WL116]TXN62196.1 hypothetical protein FV230_22275 [Methylobacterium sp. WL6]